MPDMYPSAGLCAFEDLAGAPFADGNAVRLLRSGPVYFSRMINAMQASASSICVDVYAIWDGEIGGRLIEVLCQRSAAGVSVRVIADSVGSRVLSKISLDRLRKSGVEIVLYNPFVLTRVMTWWRRTHRKIIIVDAQRAFVGGFNFVDTFLGSTTDEAWLECVIEVEGPVLLQIEKAFEDAWSRLSCCVLLKPRSVGSVRGPSRVLALNSSPATGMCNVQPMYEALVGFTRFRLWLHNPFFLPDLRLLQSLTWAIRRGVDVRVIVPGPRASYPILLHANRNRYRELLEAGVRVFEYQPTMIHAKTAVADGALVLVGSANLDRRSCTANEEFTLLVEDSAFASAFEGEFRRDLTQCVEITEMSSSRSLTERICQRIAGSIEPFL